MGIDGKYKSLEIDALWQGTDYTQFGNLNEWMDEGGTTWLIKTAIIQKNSLNYWYRWGKRLAVCGVLSKAWENAKLWNQKRNMENVEEQVPA